MSSSPWVIVWDLDHTLGVFDAFVSAADLAEPVTVQLRPGIGHVLGELREQGFVHTALTVGTPPYAETVLRGTGLREHFVEVAGRGQRPKGDAAGIAHALGIPEAERPARMIFVGDHPHLDLPQDERVVFHLELRALNRPADELKRLLLDMRERGEGSLRQGFDQLAAQAEPSPHNAALLVCTLPALGRLLLCTPEEGGPIVAFEDVPPERAPEEVTFAPLQHVPAAR